MEKRTQLARMSIACSLLEEVKQEMRKGKKEDLDIVSNIARDCLSSCNEIEAICLLGDAYFSIQQKG